MAKSVMEMLIHCLESVGTPLKVFSISSQLSGG